MTEKTKHACKVRLGQKGQHPGLHSSPRDKAVLSPEDSTQFLARRESAEVFKNVAKRLRNLTGGKKNKGIESAIVVMQMNRM